MGDARKLHATFDTTDGKCKPINHRKDMMLCWLLHNVEVKTIYDILQASSPANRWYSCKAMGYLLQLLSILSLLLMLSTRKFISNILKLFSNPWGDRSFHGLARFRYMQSQDFGHHYRCCPRTNPCLRQHCKNFWLFESRSCQWFIRSYSTSITVS